MMLPIITSLSIVALKGTLSLTLFTVCPRSEKVFPVTMSPDAALANISKFIIFPVINPYHFIRVCIKNQVEDSVVGTNKEMVPCLNNKIILILLSFRMNTDNMN